MTNPACLPGIGDELDDRFLHWRADHPEVISRFVQLAVEQKNRERKVSAKALVEYMRTWDDPPLKDFDNSLTSRLARFVMAGYPELRDYFRVRELVAHPKGRAA